MGARTVAVAVATALTLALAGCGTDEPGDDPPPGTVVLDEPWLLQFDIEDDDVGFVQSQYVIFTPETGEDTLRTIDYPMDGIEPLGTLYDAAGEWALGSHTPLEGGERSPIPVFSLTGDEDLELDLTKLTPRPEAWAFVPDRPGVLHILDEGDTLVEYSLDTKKSRQVPLAKPGPGMEYKWYFSAADGMPVASGKNSTDTPDLGEFTPHGITRIDPTKNTWTRCLDGGEEAWSYPFTDATGKTWDVCIKGSSVEVRSYDGEKWEVVAKAHIGDSLGDLRTVLPAVE